MSSPNAASITLGFTPTWTIRELDRAEARAEVSKPKIIAGRYELQRTIGSGGYGTVHEAWDRKLERRVAVKILALGDPELARAEATALARLDHPNVVKIYDHGSSDDSCYLVMQLLDGPSLGEWCTQSYRSAAQILTKLRQISRGLAAVHRAGLVHGDFKPNNVRIGPHGEAMLVDFGLARQRETVFGTDDSEPHHFGTKAYAAPERLLGQMSSARADQFSLCVTMWECLSRGNPFGPCDKEEPPVSRGLAIIAGPQGIPRGSRQVVRALRRGLSVVPSERFGSVDELLVAIEPPRTRSRWLDVGIGVVVATTIALVGSRLWPSDVGGTGLGSLVLAPWTGEVAIIRARNGDLEGAILVLEEAWDDELDPLTAARLARASSVVALEAERHSNETDVQFAWWLASRFARLAGDHALDDMAREQLYFLGATPRGR